MSNEQKWYSKILIGVSVILLAAAILGVFGTFKASIVNANEMKNIKEGQTEFKKEVREDLKEKVNVDAFELVITQLNRIEDKLDTKK